MAKPVGDAHTLWLIASDLNPYISTAQDTLIMVRLDWGGGREGRVENGRFDPKLTYSKCT